MLEKAGLRGADMNLYIGIIAGFWHHNKNPRRVPFYSSIGIRSYVMANRGKGTYPPWIVCRLSIDACSRQQMPYHVDRYV